jgi:hypothetical protein
VWLAVPGLTPRTSVVVPLNTTVAPAGTLRVILRGGRVEVHYQVEDTAVTSAHRACGTGTVGVDKGYSEVLVDGTGFLGKRVGDRLYCPHPGRVVWHAEDAAAITILDRAADADIGLYTPHRRVEQIIQDRADRPRSGLPDQDSTTAGHCRCGERNIPFRSTPIKE